MTDSSERDRGETMIEQAVLDEEIDLSNLAPDIDTVIRTDDLWKTYVMGVEEVHALRGVSLR
jgi:hypothetical protein